MADTPNLAEDILVAGIASGLTANFDQMFAKLSPVLKLAGVSGSRARELILRLAAEKAMPLVINSFRQKERKRTEKDGDAQ